MPTRPRASKARLRALIWAALLGAAPAPAAPAGAGKAVTAPVIADKEADLRELRERIETLRKGLAASEEHKSEAADRLRESERQISTLQRELNALAAQRDGLQRKLSDLEGQAVDLEARLGQQRQQLERLIYRQYLQGTPDSLQMLLNGDDPNQLARDLHYLAAIARARNELLEEMRSTLARKKALGADARARADELAAVETAQKRQHAELARQREERKAVLAQISERIQGQKKEIGSLQQNERRLSQLIERLSKLLAAQAAKPKPRPKSAPEDAGKAPAKPSEPSRTPAVEVENRFEPEANSVQFARLKGSLRLPAKGNVTGRFGTPREGGGTWRGLFIRSATGSDVRAVAAGRIVFAEWMRGFGNLLIIDHGDAFLSIYGYNDSLLKEVGETVKGGDRIATVGNSGGNPESGLYFELRHQGQPIDPMKWASLK